MGAIKIRLWMRPFEFLVIIMRQIPTKKCNALISLMVK